ncbi:MAG: hypothetical protein KGD58_00705 [Candidatus Lokiarchaeota archaeon]|nr:hypothetical protein [Candidatus Lokiarchaeota archaeon]
MPKKALIKEKKFRIIIYHGHLHKIPLDETEEEYSDQVKILSEESIKQNTS